MVAVKAKTHAAGKNLEMIQFAAVPLNMLFLQMIQLIAVRNRAIIIILDIGFFSTCLWH